MSRSLQLFVKKLLSLAGEVFLLTLTVTTVGLNGMLLVDAFNALTSDTWRATRAVVLSADGNIQYTRWKSYINIAYQYSVNDRVYTGEGVCFFELFGCSRSILKKAAMYRTGDMVPIFYSPIRAGGAVLFRDPPPAGGWLGPLCALPVVWLGSLFTFFPGWFIWKSKFIRSKHTEDPSK
ncbi:MAG TPA: DUF3592 domain-containing protein [Anaerolineales bacterium]|nr:DUF3592 domain-containing protein [Anaerolineales bacterium]